MKKAEDKKPSGHSFQQEFRARLDSIEARAKAVGLTITHVCRMSGIARATPDRWRQEAPLSVRLVDKMEAVVAEAEQARAAG